jgi:phage terminase small subunit
MNTKHIRFSEEYIIDLNATQAAIRSGYSQNRAGEIGYQLLQKTEIQDYIAELRKEQQEKAKVKVEDIIKQYLALGMYDIKDYYEDVYIMDYISSEDLKGIRCKKKYGRELYSEDFDELPVRYKKYYQPYSRLKRFDRMTKEQRIAIQGIKYDKSGNKILQLSNKQSAIDSLAKHLGMFIDKQRVEHTGQIVKRIIKVNPTGDK